jgi:hypothetical protein
MMTKKRMRMRVMMMRKRRIVEKLERGRGIQKPSTLRSISRI